MTPVTPVIANATARALFLHHHGLAEAPTGRDFTDVIDRLGFVQVDSITTVERAHHMILWARRNAWRPADLDRLAAQGAVFEHWTHDASILPMAHYPHWRLKFARDAVGMAAQWERWQRQGFAGRLDDVLDHVARHGPVMSSDLKDASAGKSTGWWDWHPSKTALAYLWRAGRLAVARRDGFRKVYDLPDRVIPAQLLAVTMPPEVTVDWACAGALQRLGFATPGEIAAFWALATPAEARAWCEAETRAGRLCPVMVEGADGTTRHAFARPGVWDKVPTLPDRLRVLSPFDPALRDRARAERLFGFRYRIEVFTPTAQRTYGYYVFPLLEGHRLVGRIDMKADRSKDVLNITALWPEPGLSFGKGRLARLQAELARIAALAGVARVDFAPNWRRDPV